jgi:putative ABC transport system permease protein
VFLEGSLTDVNQKKRFRDRVSEIPGVANAGLINNTMVSRNSNTWGVQWPGRAEDVRILFEMFTVDVHLPSTAGFEFVAGRDFSDELGDNERVILLNEAAVKAMGVEDPLDMMVNVWGEERRVIGVIKNFNYTSLHTNVEPMVMIIMPENSFAAAIRLESGSMQQTLAAIEAVYKQFNPSYPFAFHFQDERVGNLYQREQMIGALSRWFGGVAVLVSCLGLFGLSVFMTEQREKEISVRKVLGASVSELVLKLTREFTVLVLIAIGIALPVSWWIMSGWLDDFTYRIEVTGTTLFIAGAAALLISWLTVGGQSVKAALANPAETLRNE